MAEWGGQYKKITKPVNYTHCGLLNEGRIYIIYTQL